MHCSAPVNTQKSKPREPRDGVDPGVEVTKEGKKSADGALFHEERPTVLLGHSEPVEPSLNELVGELAGPEHLSHQLRWPRGLGSTMAADNVNG